jgi:large subunit ribosomal protein L17
MRHRIAHRKLNRTTSHRKALLKNLAISLINNETIETTLPKAKELKSYFDKLVTTAKKGDFNSHRAIFAKLQNKEATKKLVNEIAAKFESRNGGYTTVKRTRIRRGDASQMASISLINE